jgi:hypothetical protein
MHGNPIAESARKKAGMSEEFIRALVAYIPEPKGRQPPEPAPSQS